MSILNIPLFYSRLKRQAIFSFQDDTCNCSKCQWIFTKLGICIDILEIWFGTANGKILSIFYSYLPDTHPYSHFRTITWVNINGLSPNFVYAFILWTSGFGLQTGKFHELLTELSACHLQYFWYVHWYCGGLGGIANGQITSTFNLVICPPYCNGGVLSFHVLFLCQ